MGENIVIIGASTGGVRAVQQLLGGMAALDAIVIIVQHIPAFISQGLCDVLSRSARMPVWVATDGAIMEAGNIYLAPGDVHLKVIGNRLIGLYDGDRVNFVRPSIDVAMKSMIETWRDRIVGIILTGIGADGAAGIAHIKRIGGTTIAQDEGTSVVYGMPKAAFQTGYVDLVLTPDQIREKLVELFPA